MAPHWKCGSGQPVAGSNPALSATPRRAGRPMRALSPARPRSRTSECARSGARRPPWPRPPAPGREGLTARTADACVDPCGPRSRTPRSATRSSCHPTMKFADRDDLWPASGGFCPQMRRSTSVIPVPMRGMQGRRSLVLRRSGHTVVATRDIHVARPPPRGSGRPGRAPSVQDAPWPQPRSGASSGPTSAGHG